MNDLRNTLELEKCVEKMVQNLKQKVANEIEHTPLKETKIISSNIVVIRLSNLQRNILTPENYIPAIQAKYVAQSLDGVVTAHAFIKKIEDMIEKRSVKIGSNTYPLNDITIGILKTYYNEDYDKEVFE